MSQLGIPKMGQKSSDVRPRPPTLAASCSVPGQGYVGHTPVRRVHGRHSAGSSRVGTKPNTLEILCTELNAVPHAGLRDPNLL